MRPTHGRCVLIAMGVTLLLPFAAKGQNVIPNRC